MQVTFTQAIQLFYQRYAQFQGRANRSEFWYAMLFTFLGGIVLSWMSETLATIFAVVNFVPSIAVGVRRLHDIGKSGWWYLINLVPLIGTIWYVVLCCQPSQYDNQYGAMK